MMSDLEFLKFIEDEQGREKLENEEFNKKRMKRTWSSRRSTWRTITKSRTTTSPNRIITDFIWKDWLRTVSQIRRIMERSCIVFKLEAKDNNLVEANESENKRRCNLEMVDTAWKMTEDNRPKSTTDPPHNYRSEMTLSLTPVFWDTMMIDEYTKDSTDSDITKKVTLEIEHGNKPREEAREHYELLAYASNQLIPTKTINTLVMIYLVTYCI